MIPHEQTIIAYDRPGGPEVLHAQRAAVPVAGAGEVLIRVLAAGVNRPDLAQRQGSYPPPPGASPILGLEVAGVIAALGPGVTAHQVGEHVCALTNGGGYAEYAAVPSGQCLRWPNGYDAIRASALPETSFTVWQNLFELGGLRAGGSALVHGGSGGIGTTAIQYAAALGATVYATAGTDEKCRICCALGAAAAINYRSQDFAAEIARLTDGRGVDAILDMIGAPYLKANLASLAEDGRLVFIAFLGGVTAEKLNLGIIQSRRLSITGSRLRPLSAAAKAGIADALARDIWPILDAGRAAPVIEASFPLREAAAAHQAMERAEHVGKFVLTVAEA